MFKMKLKTKKKKTKNGSRVRNVFSNPSTASYCTNEWERLSIINTYYCTHYAVGVRTFNLINPMYGMVWARVAPLAILFSIWFKLVAVWWMRTTECVCEWRVYVSTDLARWKYSTDTYNEFGDARAPAANFRLCEPIVNGHSHYGL